MEHIKGSYLGILLVPSLAYYSLSSRLSTIYLYYSICLLFYN